LSLMKGMFLLTQFRDQGNAPELTENKSKTYFSSKNEINRTIVEEIQRLLLKHSTQTRL
jgi:hypothetical protein